jgi:hypothetical protein
MTKFEKNRKMSTLGQAMGCENPAQVQLTISTDYGFTADFLRQLANEIEASDNEFTDYETYRGVARIVWPE